MLSKIRAHAWLRHTSGGHRVRVILLSLESVTTYAGIKLMIQSEIHRFGPGHMTQGLFKEDSELILLSLKC